MIIILIVLLISTPLLNILLINYNLAIVLEKLAQRNTISYVKIHKPLFKTKSPTRIINLEKVIKLHNDRTLHQFDNFNHNARINANIVKEIEQCHFRNPN